MLLYKKLDIINTRIVDDIYICEEALELIRAIAMVGEQLERKNFGNLFGRIQNYCLEAIFIKLCGLYERSRKNKLRNIDRALAIIKNSRKSIVIKQPYRFIENINRTYKTSISSSEKNHFKIIQVFLNEFENELKVPFIINAIKDIKTWRDKYITHPEDCEFINLPKTTYAQIEDLIELAQKFVMLSGELVGKTSYYDNGEDGYIHSNSAKRTSISLKRLLEKAGFKTPDSPF